MLDIGCGEGLLIQRLIPFATNVVGIDPDEKAIAQSKARFGVTTSVTLIHGDFLDMPVPTEDKLFDTIICVAALHHMDLRAALTKMREFLAPGGKLLVVGLSADKSIFDLFISGLSIVPIRIMDWYHGGVMEIDVKIATPNDSISEIRKVACEVLPGAKVQRRFYYRFLLTWDKDIKTSDE